MRIQGLETFRRYFADYTEQYTLIGGVACYLAMDEAGLDFRVTKDLDIVLCAEALTPAFVNRLWEFIGAAGYETQEKSSGERQFYRFAKPRNAEFPVMLELFSRVPDGVTLVGDAHLTPIPMGDEADSLSAILLNDDYYACIDHGRAVIDGISLLGPEYVLPFKAKAWLDLSGRRAAGEPIDSKNIKKHRNDVFRLFPLLSPTQTVGLNYQVKHDLRDFLQAMSSQTDLELANFGIQHLRMTEVLRILQTIYGLNNE